MDRDAAGVFVERGTRGFGEIKTGTEIECAADATFRAFQGAHNDAARFLFRSQTFPNGAVLLTGTGIVPPETFSLEEGDEVRIEIDGIGTLLNSVVRV